MSELNCHVSQKPRNAHYCLQSCANGKKQAEEAANQEFVARLQKAVAVDPNEEHDAGL